MRVSGRCAVTGLQQFRVHVSFAAVFAHVSHDTVSCQCYPHTVRMFVSDSRDILQCALSLQNEQENCRARSVWDLRGAPIRLAACEEGGSEVKLPAARHLPGYLVVKTPQGKEGGITVAVFGGGGETALRWLEALRES